MQSPADAFTAGAFEERRKQVFSALEGSALVLPAAPVRTSSRDTEYPYRPDSELFYATGLVEPQAVAVLRDHVEEDRFVIFVRPRDEEAELWAGPRLGPVEAAARFGASAAYSTTELPERLPDLLNGARYVYHRLGIDPRMDRLIQESLLYGRLRGPKEGDGPRGVLDPGEVLDELRLRKDTAEIAQIRRATAISAEAHREAMSRARPGLGERELQAILEESFGRRGADGPAFGTIVGAGVNACVLHYVANDSVLAAGELVLVDAGTSVGLYNGDVTRTYPVDGSFTHDQRAAYDVVNRARRAAIDAVRPGASAADVHDVAVRVQVEGLIGLGVLQGAVEELVEADAHKPFFPHRTSHWLGLDVHDVGDYSRDGVSRELEPGMVLTVEPGLYFRPGADGVPPGLSGVGIRIEDDVLVTETGCDVLTDGVPSDPDEIESLVGSAAG